MTVLHDLPDAEYHGTPGITFHRLLDFIDNGPAYYCARHVTGTMPPKPETDWGQLGKGYHVYALEGEDRFADAVVRMPTTYWTDPPVDAPWNNRKKYCQEWVKAHPGETPPATFPDGDPAEERPWSMSATRCKEWVASHHGKIVLSNDDYEAAIAIGRNARANRHAARLLAMGWPEITIQHVEPGFPVPVKCRIDWLASTSTAIADAWAIVDVKGVDGINQFERDVFKYRYHRQMAFYRWMVQQETGRLLPAFLPAVEKGGMHRCRVFALDEALLDEAHEVNMRDIDRLKACYASNVWPLDHDDSLRVISPRITQTEEGACPW